MFENGYALIIGVDQNLDPKLPLPTVAKDITAVQKVITHPDRCAYNPDNVKLVSGPDATKDNIMDALIWLKEQVDADPSSDATAVFYYSGHGWVDPNSDKYYLIPYDIKDRSKLVRYALPAETFTELLADIDPQRMLIILDCCHSAGVDAKGIGDTATDTDIGQFNGVPAAFPVELAQASLAPNAKGLESKDVSDLQDGEGRAILNSSTGSQQSWTRADGAMSLFTYHLIEALTGHAPHDDSDKVVYVTDVMSWVTRRVKESAAALARQYPAYNIEQTPVMKTSGVFPIAQLIGGKGLQAKSLGETPPDPLAPLPPTGDTATFNQQNQTVGRDQYNIGKVEGNVGHIGPDNRVDTGGGDYVGGNKIEGDWVGGDKVAGDKFQDVNVSGNQGSAISIGRGSTATTTTTTYQGSGQNDNLAALFAPLQQLVAQQNPALSGKVNALKEQVGRGAGADDNTMSTLIRELTEGVPAAKAELAALFKRPEVDKSAGPTTKFIVGLFG